MRPWPVCLALMLASSAAAAEVDWKALLDVRAVAADEPISWTRRGQGKTQLDARDDGLVWGKGVLVLDARWDGGWSADAVIEVDDRHDGTLDLTEASLRWKPIPSGPWRHRLRLGLFFLPGSEENDGLGWTAPRTVSYSAINTWLGEELRTIGAEWTLSRPGRFVGSAYDFEFFAALFGANDPATGLLTWRGWSLGDRVTGLRERIALPYNPVWRPGGALPGQAPWIEPFHEIDGRIGAYAGLRWAREPGLHLSALRYDNRGDPAAFEDGQYAWRVRFDHVGFGWQPAPEWELLGQWLSGDTAMGHERPFAVDADYRAAYLLLSRAWTANQFTLRRERFAIDDNDVTPNDDNSERGRAWALAWRYGRPDSRWSLVAEWLHIDSDRPARLRMAAQSRRIEQSLSLSLRWQLD